MDLDIQAELGAAIGRKLEPMEARIHRMMRAAAGERIQLAGSASDGQGTITVASQTAIKGVADMVVPVSQVWEIRSLRVVMGGSAPATSQAGVAWFFARDGDYSASSYRDDTSGTTLPNVAFYSAGQFQLFPGSRLSMLVISYTAGQSYSFAAEGLAFPVDTRPTVTAGE